MRSDKSVRSPCSCGVRDCAYSCRSRRTLGGGGTAKLYKLTSEKERGTMGDGGGAELLQNNVDETILTLSDVMDAASDKGDNKGAERIESFYAI